ncbi:M33 protein [Murid betaherpesvirus 1]|nr:M33 protein [Murid betaherpesvirus 1]AWV68290.1 M33 protein [Murid betaherpesvirus 1]
MDVLLGRDETMDETDYLHVNNTCTPSLGLSIARDAETAINTVIILIGGPMNFVVLTTQLLSNRIYRSSAPTLYMTNLYFANLLTVTMLPFLILSNRGQISSSPEGCKMVAVTYYASCTAGFSTLALISVNRYRVIHQSTNKNAAGSKKKTYGVLALVWLTSLMCASPAPTYVTVLAHDGDTSDSVHETCIIFFNYDQVKTVLATFKILICIVWGVMPVVMMTWFYLFFYKRLKLTSYRRRSHTLAFVSTLILSFLVLQTPFVGIMIFDSYAVIEWDVTCESINSRDAVAMLARVVPNFHCMLNPVLYAFLGRDFNKRFMQCITGKLFSRRRMLQERAGVRSPSTPHRAARHLAKIGTLTRSCSRSELQRSASAPPPQ